MRARQRRLQRDARRQRINQVLIGIFFIAIMVGSIWGFSQANAPTQQGDSRFSFNGEAFEVKADQGTLVVHGFPQDVAPGHVVMRNIFNQLVTVDMQEDVAPLLANAEYIATTFDPATPQPDIQVLDLIRYSLRQLPNHFDGILTPDQRYASLQQVTCANAQATYPVVQFLVTNATLSANVTREGDCVTVAGDAQGLLAAKDVLLLTLGGVL
ncbi:hypothetical protein D6789_00030 [Candidatus Woesearchaeota archaeon]|nr:MAG: hypothetical protein D6789_00030 [Candidatus Woesearchaeota archaeon]